MLGIRREAASESPDERTAVYSTLALKTGLSGVSNLADGQGNLVQQRRNFRVGIFYNAQPLGDCQAIRGRPDQCDGTAILHDYPDAGKKAPKLLIV